MPKSPLFCMVAGLLVLWLSACTSTQSSAEREAAKNGGSNVEVYGVIDAGVGHTRISQ